MKWEDHYEIEQLLYKYPECADTGNFAGVGELFQYCEMVVPGQANYRAPSVEAYTAYYAKWVRKFPDSGTPKTRHVMSNISISMDGAPDRAKSRSYVSVFQGTDKLPLQPIVVGTYLDKFQKVDGKWRFVERFEDMELIGNCSEHLLISWK